MFEVDVKNVTEEGRRGGEGRRGPARVWGSDWDAGILGCWDIGMLGYWDTGILVITGVLGYSGTGDFETEN